VLLKLALPDTSVERVRVAGAPGVWLGGDHHVLITIGRGGNEYFEPLYLVGNTLLWERGGRSYRLEADVDRETAVRIAESLGNDGS
jgi:hypothetical protein